ncbi:hypothetical protein CBP51_14330 [Cellvibrio mixtus]|uniref:DUF2721 domain-containing protein n=1 Tax=Cellvibrio mixtus TaxID=39650 RepID=A0A266Q3D0_9GAMM|nr:hypothetical protein [Cellvibrio mixtus]OZY84384.1 hypothetical protein CBP51_14330 [Cellvibrio mixtus]
MDEFVKGLSSPSWWVGVVIVGILINLISSLLIKFFGFLLKQTSEKWRNKEQIKNTERQKTIEKIKSNEKFLYFYMLSEIRYMVCGASYCIFSLCCFFAAVQISKSNIYIAFIGMITATITLHIGFRDFNKAIKLHCLIKDASEEYRGINT